MIMKSKYSGFCKKCYYSFYKGELINYNGKALHADCVQALTDSKTRRLNPSYASRVGKVSRQDMVEFLTAKSSKPSKHTNRSGLNRSGVASRGDIARARSSRR